MDLRCLEDKLEGEGRVWLFISLTWCEARLVYLQRRKLWLDLRELRAGIDWGVAYLPQLFLQPFREHDLEAIVCGDRTDV